jgi:hypothetical protein
MFETQAFGSRENSHPRSFQRFWDCQTTDPAKIKDEHLCRCIIDHLTAIILSVDHFNGGRKGEFCQACLTFPRGRKSNAFKRSIGECRPVIKYHPRTSLDLVQTPQSLKKDT